MIEQEKDSTQDSTVLITGMPLVRLVSQYSTDLLSINDANTTLNNNFEAYGVAGYTIQELDLLQLRDAFVRKTAKHYAWNEQIGAAILKEKGFKPLNDEISKVVALLEKGDKSNDEELEQALKNLRPLISVPGGIRIRREYWPGTLGIATAAGTATIYNFVTQNSIPVSGALLGTIVGGVVFGYKHARNNSYIEDKFNALDAQRNRLIISWSTGELNFINEYKQAKKI